MTSSSYILGRKQWARPQAMLWSDEPGTIVSTETGTFYAPSGYELYSDYTGLTSDQINNSFIILSDHNRSDINISTQRIEHRQRMVNGTMRSYHTADKLTISTSWQMIPSRGYSTRPDFNQATGLPAQPTNEYTADGGAGGAEMVKWYEDHTGPFWVFLAYDKHTNFGDDDMSRRHLAEYNQALQMYISSFEYTIVKRGASNHDLWNITVSLEEA